MTAASNIKRYNMIDLQHEHSQTNTKMPSLPALPKSPLGFHSFYSHSNSCTSPSFPQYLHPLHPHTRSHAPNHPLPNE